MTEAKFKAGDLVRIGGPDGRMPERYDWMRRGRIVRIYEVKRNQDFLGKRHSGYIILGRRGRPTTMLASYELRPLEERDRAPRGC